MVLTRFRISQNIYIFSYITRYLQEIGYTDTIIDVRSTRVRQLLGLQPNNIDSDVENRNTQMVNGEQPGKRSSDSQGKRWAHLI